MPLSCRLGHRQTSTQELEIAAAIHNCGISSKSGVHPPSYTPCIPPHKPYHSLPSYTILLACPTSKPLFIKQSSMALIHLFRGLPTAQLLAHSLSNPIILHSYHLAKPLDNTFINPFFNLHNSHIHAFGTLSLLLITSNPLKLSICTVLIIDLSFFYNTVSLPYIRTGTSNVSFKNLAYSRCKSLALTRDLRVH